MWREDDSEELVEGFPFLRRRRDGTYRRLYGTDVLPPSIDVSTGVSSKDVIIDSSSGISGRIFLPQPPSSSDQKLPLIIYFHGGAFCIHSAASPPYHNYLNSLASQARAVCVSINYRLAPENSLPAAYQDSVAALSWVFAKTDPWLIDHGDFRRVFIAGDSAGGNIAHNLATKIVETFVEGLLLVHPFFCFTPEDEMMQKVWKFLYPTAERGLEETCVNPTAKAFAALGCRRVLLCLAEEDGTKKSGLVYHERLQSSGFRGKVEEFESMGEGHVFHLLKPDSDSARELMERVVQFIKGDDLEPAGTR